MHKIKYIIGILIILTTLSTIGYASEIKKDTGYISLSASKTQEIEPNIAKVTFAVENTDNEAQKAAAKNNEISNQIITALKAVTESQTDTIKTNDFSVRPIYTTTTGGKRVIKNYMARNSITVETKDTQKIAKLIDTAIKNGANRTEGLYYAYENDNSVCNKIYPELIKDLKIQASSLAQAAGTSIDGIRQINASCSTDMAVSNGRFFAKAMLNSAMDTAEEAISTPVEAGKVNIRVHVNVDFYVK